MLGKPVLVTLLAVSSSTLPIKGSAQQFRSARAMIPSGAPANTGFGSPEAIADFNGDGRPDFPGTHLQLRRADHAIHASSHAAKG